MQLTARRCELLQLLADGKTLEDAAVLMGITPNAVRNTAVIIREQLEAETTLHAVAIALRRGLII